MRILRTTLPSPNYEGFLNQNLGLDAIKRGFSQANLSFFERRIALWQNLRHLLESSGTYAKSITSNNGVLVEGDEITSLILGEAVEYFCRSFYNFYAQDKLIENCYSTWSEVTNYYASFFSIHSLLRLQGRCITRLWRPGGKEFYIFPYDFLSHQYVICTNRVQGKSAHDAVWSIYYDVYDGFLYSENLHFETIFKKKNVGTPEEEIDFRNQINYEPYQGYAEIRDPDTIPEIIEKYENKRFTENEIEALSRLTTDPDYKYYARSVLRLIFSYKLLTEIAGMNRELDTLLCSRRNALSNFLGQANPRNEEDMIGQRVQVLMRLRGS